MVRRGKTNKPETSFSAHVEYLFHITCEECGFYWTYASMDKDFDIEGGSYSCPLCAQKGGVKLRDVIGETE
ncbi:MAG: hypothetical protein AAGI10_06825 [Pseudomonadota bacterium]